MLSQSFSGNFAPEEFNAPGLIGNDRYVGGRNFNGVIDEVAVFNYALAPVDLQNLFDGIVRPQQVRLTIQPSGATVILTWPQGTLLQADNLTGPWTTNTTTSPYAAPPAGTQRFYRLLVR